MQIKVSRKSNYFEYVVKFHYPQVAKVFAGFLFNFGIRDPKIRGVKVIFRVSLRATGDKCIDEFKKINPQFFGAQIENDCKNC